jgi:hypothetical protein
MLYKLYNKYVFTITFSQLILQVSTTSNASQLIQVCFFTINFSQWKYVLTINASQWVQQVCYNNKCFTVNIINLYVFTMNYTQWVQVFISVT